MGPKRDITRLSGHVVFVVGQQQSQILPRPTSLSSRHIIRLLYRQDSTNVLMAGRNILDIRKFLNLLKLTLRSA